VKKELSVPESPPSPTLPPLGPLVLIAAVVGIGAAAFAYTAGWLSPDRLTPEKIVDSLTPPSGEPLGHRRNHGKGICFTGAFEANGAGSELSRAQVFARGEYPVVGRFNLASADPNAKDGAVRVHGVGVRIAAPDGQEWRMAMITAPVFPVATPQGFYELQMAAKSKDPNAMPTFVAAHPEFGAFANWAKSAPWTGSYAEDQFHSLNSFVFTDGSGTSRTVRWALKPQAQPVSVSPDDLAKRDPNFLEQEITQRVQTGPQRWTMVVTVANPEDPTADPTKAWPDDRRTVEVGTLVVRQIEAERDGPCRDINFDPAVLPSGIQTSDDPFPAARSAAYSNSFDRRTAETQYYPRTATGAKP
jgi:catalase